ncbi:Oidioi.mRNA.OKI2018_I69.XSR.g16661.t1.cds [Oikopleura dioica]|uniref:Oidioi.mRNA.OKI2018_I69.XSR.g16661.t1.cds n=1 Tax=Oikopleura dioica TaxID=34765 RepID=A0ABN7SKS9_OIKDI|nr:Oidioi.mRNA.OKI2018_I69.XSR.g16661.t1.cds [Oikopleura dioica]
MQSTHRGQLMLGQLPDEFLRSNVHTELTLALYSQLQREQGERASVRAAEALATQEASRGSATPVAGASPGQFPSHVPYVTVGRLSVTVVEARLAKSYSMLGITRMDPYCRIRVGHNVYETETSHNGGKNPMWGKILYATLPNGVDSFTVEIFDEKSFTKDERVAYATIPIPPRVFDGETVNEFYNLSGKQGLDQEGQGTDNSIMRSTESAFISITEDINQIHEMFPTTDKSVIKTVLTANNGNKDAAIESLLQMQ